MGRQMVINQLCQRVVEMHRLAPGIQLNLGTTNVGPGSSPPGAGSADLRSARFQF